MFFKVKVLQILCIFVIFLSVSSSTKPPSSSNKNSKNKAGVNVFYKGLEQFGHRLYSKLAVGKKNTVFSDFSIQTCLAMTRMGADGMTGEEMDKVLGSKPQKLQAMAKNYHDTLEKYQDSPILQIVNKIYIMKDYKVQPKFKQLVTNKFFSSIEDVNFANSKEAANTINSWIENETDNLITDLIDPTSLSEDTRLVLLNVIHFRGAWTHPFPKKRTQEMDFYLDETKTTKVQMMHTEAKFNYGELPGLDAKVLEMTYKDTDLSLVIILPNSRTGLANLEKKLTKSSLSNIASRMRLKKVAVHLPRFKVEFKTELKEHLKQMGMKLAFTEKADFGKMIQGKQDLLVSSVIHKAYIEVNEEGTEAAAATAVSINMLIATLDTKPAEEFVVDKPFYYVIKNEMNVVLFQGSIKNAF